MAGPRFISKKLKRKDLDVNDDFSDFSLSSPAPKTRRLDAELCPIIGECREIPLVFQQSAAPEENFASNTVPMQGRVSGPVIEELPAVPENDERAIVLFKPMNTPLFQSPSNLCFSVDSDIIAGIKDRFSGPKRPML